MPNRSRRSVHMPVDVELQQRNTESPDSNTSTDLGDFLVKSYAKQIKERNSSTANVHYYLLHGSKSSTDYSKDNMLGQHAPADYRRSYWLRELTVLNKDRLWDEEQKILDDLAKKEAVNRKLAAEEYNKKMNDPENISWLREGPSGCLLVSSFTPVKGGKKSK